MRAVVVRRLQALQVVVQVPHGNLSGSAPVVEGNVRGRKGSAWPQPPSADLATPGKRPGNVLPWSERDNRCPRPGQRPRVDQSGKRETAQNALHRSDARCVSGSSFGGGWRESTAPGPR